MSERLDHLVVLVPGMGGTRLVDPERRPGDQVVWGDGLGSLVKALADPSRLAVDRPLHPSGLLDEFAIIPWFKNVEGYTAMRERVRSVFPEDNAGKGPALIVEFGYDFRLGVDAAAELLADLIGEHLAVLRDAGATVSKALIVAHSMGGLVARRWATLPDQASLCRGIIALGTPFRGAPKALDVLANGIYFRNRKLQRRAFSAVLQSWPGLVDLVSTDGRVLEPDRSVTDPQVPGKVDDLPHIDRIRAAAELHGSTLSAWEDFDDDLRPALFPLGGTGHSTINSVSWDGRRLRPVRTLSEGEPSGDGTVPHWASIPPELGGLRATERLVATGERHDSIADSAFLWDRLAQLNRPDPPSPQPVEVAPPGRQLGLTIDEIAPVGEDIVFEVTFGNEPVGDGVVLAASSDGENLRVEETDDGYLVRAPRRETTVELGVRLDVDGQRHRTRARVGVLDD